ncbi:chromosome partitioning protein [Nakamurella flavida]|uniref:Chromosome partitioning protein n=2 Tax=Nakamurella flavida TaxID=363630 RepID=A0A939C0R6_9ACTN|nr:chromosome partitioning protein [Nakamurella flavida]MBM9476998.1 chromosome partitioning protein [Nakamurella flavida]
MLDRPGAPMSVVRRCVDVADVLAHAATGRASVAVVAADLRRLDTDAIHRLTVAGLAVVGVHPAADDRARTRLERIGISVVVPDEAGSTALVEAARSALNHLALDRDLDTDLGERGQALDRAVADTRAALPPTLPIDPDPDSEPAEPPARGVVVAVWGPTGAPGRTTVAAGLAADRAAAGLPTLLVDADVYGGVLASAFGLLDESPGLAGACRMAANGRLDVTALSQLSWTLGPTLRLLTGLARADRWPEMRPSAIPAVLDVCRETAALTVVDVGFCLEADEEITFDTAAPRRNGATLALLAEADIVLAVGSADPPGMERLIRGLAELAEMVPEADPTVVLNRCRSAAASADEAVEALRRFTGRSVAAQLPEDRAATDRAWHRAVPLPEAAAGSPLTGALTRLARSLDLPAVVPAGR